MCFSELSVKTEIVRALKEDGIEEPTSIQKKAIPLIKSGKDVIGMSKTGSGKTVAFGVPILEKIVPGQGVQVLILTPTRELAVQISNELRKFSKYMKCFVATIFGGVSYDPQIRDMSRADIVVATPGRLLDHLGRRNLDITKLTCFVLDEADKMVEMGFIEDIEQILGYSNRERQVLLFGATISDEIDHIKRTHMKDPAKAEADSRVKEEYLKQEYYNVEQNEKFSLLVHLLKKEETDRVMIFCSARSTVELVAKNLKLQNIKVEMLHGKMSQNRRLRVLGDFHKSTGTVLVASAVAARGLDIKDVSHIFNYDLSQDPQEYIHRVGRTARAGASGKAITLLCHKDYEPFQQILDRYDMDVKEIPKGQFTRLRFDARRIERNGRGFGGRDSGRRGYSGGGRGYSQRGGFGSGGNGRSHGRGSYSGGSHGRGSFNGPRRESGGNRYGNSNRDVRKNPSAPGWNPVR